MEPDDPATEVALARYAVIAPLVRRELNRAEFRAEVRRIAAARHHFPEGNNPMAVTRRISPRHVRRWVQWYKFGRREGDRVVPPGLDALKPLPRADRGQPRVMSADLIDRAVRLRAEAPERNTASLVQHLQAEAREEGQTPPDIHEATLAFHLRARGATRQKMKQEGQVHRRYQHTQRNDCWQGDITGGLWLPNPQDPKRPRQCFLHAFKDDRTRYVPHAEFYFRQTMACHCDAFRKAVIAGGRPSVFYCDNGSSYQNRQARLMAARLGIEVVFATPYAPEGKGKIERFFGHVKDAFYPEARHANLQTLAELNEFFWAWLDRYHDTVHSEIQATPRALWEAEAATVQWPEPAQLADAFLWEETRRVDRAGCVHLSDNLYPVAEHLVGQRVTLRFDPFDLSSVRVYQRGVFVEVARPQELSSHTFRKALPRRTEKPLPLESADTLRRQFTQGFRERLLAETAASGPPGRTSPSGPCLTRVELTALVAEVLAGRALTDVERNLVADFFLRYAPLEAAAVRQALLTAVEDKGTQLHLRFYLEALKAARSPRKGGA